MNYSVLQTFYRHDTCDFLDISIQSVIRQTIPPAEIILVQDGIVSNELEEFIDNLVKNNKIIKIIKLKVNLGLGLALAEGMKHCSNNLIMRMDSDDYSSPKRAKYLMDCIMKDGADVVGCNIGEFYADFNKPSRIIKYKNRVPSGAMKKYLRDPVGHASVMFKKTSVDKSGGYKHCLFFEDTYLWLRMSKAKCTFSNIDDVLYFARIGSGFIERRSGLEYFYIEYKNFILFYKEKLITLPYFLLNIAIRFIVRLLPIAVLKKIYSIMLRSKV
jgi:glycosyltransferase involved in cell wall biosynthesis